MYHFLFVDEAMTIPWTDPDITLTPSDPVLPETLAGSVTSQTISVKTTSGFKKTVYVQGMNTGKRYDWAKMTFIVCGQEIVTCN